jgi:hypothetical protein
MPQIPPPDESELAVLHEVLDALRRLRFGSIQVIVQDSRVVQIDTVEKKRFSDNASRPDDWRPGPGAQQRRTTDPPH